MYPFLNGRQDPVMMPLNCVSGYCPGTVFCPEPPASLWKNTVKDAQQKNPKQSVNSGKKTDFHHQEEYVASLKTKLKNSTAKLKADLSQMLEQGKLSDVLLVVKDGEDPQNNRIAQQRNNKKREFRAHKAILAGRSAVFAAMFEHDTLERRENRINIEDMTPELCNEMLRYIYTGKVAKLNENAEELLVIADKYGLDGLKGMCEVSLCASLTNDSVLRLLALANMHNAVQLKAVCGEYFAENAKKIVVGEDWSKLTASQPELLGMLFKNFVLKN